MPQKRWQHENIGCLKINCLWQTTRAHGIPYKSSKGKRFVVAVVVVAVVVLFLVLQQHYFNFMLIKSSTVSNKVTLNGLIILTKDKINVISCNIPAQTIVNPHERSKHNLTDTSWNILELSRRLLII